MITNLITLGAALLFTLPLSARQLTPAEAINRMQAENGMSSRHRVPASQLTLAYTATEGEQSLLYVMNRPAESGFVVLSADDCAPAVLGYTDNGSFDGEKVPDSFKWWMSLCEQDIAQAITANKSIQRVSSSVVVSPLMTTKWNQTSPFNCYMNWTLSSGKLTAVTGCVAVAMAQIMKYHKWPLQGQGSTKYNCTFTDASNNHATYSLSTDFSESTYNWGLMKDDYSSYTTDQAYEVGKLLVDCAYSVKAQFGVEQSSAAAADVPSALVSYFDYDLGISYEKRSSYSDAEWESMILNELQANRPVLYSGRTTTDAGHAFVVDGHSADGKYHINWGWGGYCDGYFLMTGSGALHPGGTGTGGGGENASYDQGQEIVIGIQPNTHTIDHAPVKMTASEYEIRTASLDSNGYVDESTWQTVSTSNRSTMLFVYGDMMNTGIMACNIRVGVKLSNAQHTYYCEYSKNLTYASNNGPRYYTFYCTDVMANGTYNVYPVFKDLDSPNPQWQEMDRLPTTVIPTLTVTGSDEPDIFLKDLAYLTCKDIRTKDNQMTATNAVLHFKIEAVKSFSSKRIICWIFPKAGGTSLGYFETMLSAMNAGEVREISIEKSLAGLSVGTPYVVRIDDYSKSVVLPPTADNSIPLTICSQITPTLEDVNYLKSGLLRDGFGFSISNITDVINIIKK